MAAEKQLIVAVEGTAAIGPFWQPILGDYIEKIVRAFSCGEVTGQKLSDASCEFALVVFNSHGPFSACLVQRSGWTKDVDIFLQWLSTLTFSGGGFGESAITDGLSEALLMFSTIPNTNQSQQHIDSLKHCILVAGSNPNPLPTPVPKPAALILDKSDNAETPADVFLADAETIARSFPQSFVSLSVVAPKQLHKLRAIFNAGKRNPRAIDPTVDYTKNPQFLVLLSENFLEARLALSQPGMTGIQPNQVTTKLDGPSPTTSNPANVTLLNRQAMSTINVSPATVKVEPTTLPSLSTSAAFPHLSSVANTTSQGNPTLPTSSAPSVSQEMNTNAESVQEFKPVVNPAPQPRPVGPGAANVNILNSLSQARQVMNASMTGGNSMGLNTIANTPMAMHMSNMISNGMASSGLSTVASSGLSGMTTIPGSGALMATAPVGQNTALTSFSSTVSNMSGNSSIALTSSLPTIQGTISMGQSLPGLSQSNLSVSQMGPNVIGMNQNVMNGLSASSISSGAGNMIPTPGMSQQIQPGLHSLGPTNGSLGATSGSLGVTNSSIIMPQQQAGGAQQPKYVKIWEGALSGQRQGQPVFICKLEGYRSSTASEKLAEDWPPSMQIVRLISQDHMNNKQYVGKADFLVFRTLNQHGFLGQLQEKKLCAVIQLPSQTLLLSVSEKASRLIGMLFPGDMVVFKPQIPNQQQQLQQQQQMQQLQQQNQQLQQQPPQHQPQQLRPQMVSQAMGQTFVQGTGRPQMMAQGMMSQQGPGNMPTGGGFMP